ncbi:homeobox protein PKNOX1 isoform X1, partial [Tachysurus ichikawai]
DAVSSQGGENLYASRSVSSYFMNIHELSGLRALRGDATQQLRVPIAAAACHCDEDWH